MPPVRTAKSQSITSFFTPIASPVQRNPADRKRLAPTAPSRPGQTTATFERNEDREKRKEVLGSNTKSIVFQYHFHITDQHVDDMEAMGRTWRALTYFDFNAENATTDDNNSADGLTDAGIIKLAKLCPNLRVLCTHDTRGLTDASLEALFSNCLEMTELEIGFSLCSSSRKGLMGKAFDELRMRRLWAPKLKEMTFNSPTDIEEDKDFMREIRALGKDRPKLKVDFVRTGREKKSGDWEYTSYRYARYVKGRKTEVKERSTFGEGWI